MPGDSGPRVGGVEHATESLFAHMGVVLGGGEIRMAQQFLHRSEVSPTIEQMGGEGVTQRVGMSGRGRPTIEQSPDIAGAESAPLLVEEHCV